MMNLTLRLGSRRRNTSAIVLACFFALSTRPAPAQIGNLGNIAGGVAGSATSQVMGDLLSGVIGPFLLLMQVGEVFNEVFTSGLNLPQTQLQQLREIRDEMAAKTDALKSLPAAERRQKLLAMVPQLEAEYIGRVEKVLDDEQRAQFRRLLRQLRGPSSLLEPEVAQQLKLSAKQREQLTAIKQKYNDEIEDLVSDGGDVGPLKMTAMLGLRKRRDKALLEVLTDEQAEQWTELKGKQHLDVEGVIGKVVKTHLANLLAKSRADRAKGKTQDSTTDGPAPPAPKKR